MTQKFKHFSSIAVAAIVLFATSCSKDDDPIPEENDNEVITTVQLRFKEQGTTNELLYAWKGADGAGGNAPVIDQIALQPGKSYDVSVSFLDEVNGEDITEEVSEENIDHRIYYVPSSTSNIQITNLDKDDNNVTLGLESIWTTTTASTGTVRVVLRHYPQGGKIETDLINDPKSSTDVDIQFNSKVE
ncbi:hypothetical protein ACTFAO_17960 [Sphingobacterium spiritivorum]|uniref:hypothetical protein n=1 Tax=Sphingobacterium spiritivorum TaxID=258 RepID=UPI003F7608E0